MTFNIYSEIHNDDFKFFDSVVSEQFSVGGTIVYIHKYLGPAENFDDPDDLTKDGFHNGSLETDIGDKVLMETKNRRYDPDIYSMWGHYPIQDTSFDLMQFGIALSGSDTNYFTFHMNDMIERIGRKLMAGDVLEVAHMRDYNLLGDDSGAINRYYVVQDGDRPAEGFSPTWRGHIWRVRSTPLIDAPEFQDVIDRIEAQTGRTDFSVRDKELTIMDQVMTQADIEVPLYQMDQHHLWVDVDASGNIVVFSGIDTGTLTGDGAPPNLNQDDVQSGTLFPTDPGDGDYFLRVDYEPQRLFQWDATTGAWRQRETQWRREWSPANKRFTDFINNQDTFVAEDKKTYQSRMGLTEAIKAREDLGSAELSNRTYVFSSAFGIEFD